MINEQTTGFANNWRAELLSWYEKHRAHFATLGFNFAHCYRCNLHVIARMDTGALWREGTK